MLSRCCTCPCTGGTRWRASWNRLYQSHSGSVLVRSLGWWMTGLVQHLTMDYRQPQGAVHPSPRPCFPGCDATEHREARCGVHKVRATRSMIDAGCALSMGGSWRESTRLFRRLARRQGPVNAAQHRLLAELTTLMRMVRGRAGVCSIAQTALAMAYVQVYVRRRLGECRHCFLLMCRSSWQIWSTAGS